MLSSSKKLRLRTLSSELDTLVGVHKLIKFLLLRRSENRRVEERFLFSVFHRSLATNSTCKYLQQNLIAQSRQRKLISLSYSSKYCHANVNSNFIIMVIVVDGCGTVIRMTKRDENK